MPFFNFSRDQKARWACWVAQPSFLILWLKVMGVCVAIFFALFIYVLVAPVFLKQVPAFSTHWYGLIPVALNLLFLGTRHLILRQGWLPVSRRDLKRLSSTKNTEALLDREAQARWFAALKHSQGWLNWKEAWALSGLTQAPPLISEWGGLGFSWKEDDEKGSEEDMLAFFKLEAVRSGQAQATQTRSLPKTRRTRA